MRKRITAAAGLAALALTATPACAGGGTSTPKSGGGSSAKSTGSGTELAVPAGPVTITFEEAMTIGTLKPAMDKLVSDFQAKYPNITVKLQGEPDYATMYTKEKAEVQAGNARPSARPTRAGPPTSFLRHAGADQRLGRDRHPAGCPRCTRASRPT